MRNRTRFAAGLLAAGLAAHALVAGACGACVEDRIAVVYDHAVAADAARRAHGVAYLAIEGPLPADAKGDRAVRAALASVAGVDRASVRVSLEHGACSAAFDPARVSVAAIVAGANQRLARHGLVVVPLRTDIARASPPPD